MTRQEPKGPEYAKGIIAEMTCGTKSEAARRALARTAISVGNYTDEAKAVFQEYLDEHPAF